MDVERGHVEEESSPPPPFAASRVAPATGAPVTGAPVTGAAEMWPGCRRHGGVRWRGARVRGKCGVYRTVVSVSVASPLSVCEPRGARGRVRRGERRVRGLSDFMLVYAAVDLQLYYSTVLDSFSVPKVTGPVLLLARVQYSAV